MSLVGTTMLGVTDGAAPAVLSDLLIILAAAGVVAIITQRVRLAIIPAYLLTGVIIGPGALGIISGPERIDAISELALILLMFGIGLHMDLSMLRRDMRRLVTTGIAAVTFSIAVLWPVSMIGGLSAPAALTVGIALSMSSTAVVLRLLQLRRELHHTSGRLTFAILIIQDLATIIVLMILPPLARWNGTGSAGVLERATGTDTSPLVQILFSGGIAMVGIGALLLVGKYILPRVLLEAARQRSGEAMIVVSTAAALGAAALTNTLGISPALGAFLGGFMLSSTPFRHHLSGQISTIRDLFSAVFFTAIGMTVGVDAAIAHFPYVIAGAVGLLALKGLMIALGVWISGATGNLSLRVGLVLCQGGEFGIVILEAASSDGLGLLQRDEMSVIIAMIVLSLMVTPAIIALAPSLDRHLPSLPAPKHNLTGWSSTKDQQQSEPSATGGLHVIVAGFGLVGRAVADSLTAKGGHVTIVEMNPTTVQTQRRLGRRIEFGDISNPDVLESAGIHDADALILTFPDEAMVLRACHTARRMKGDLVIIARLNYVAKGMAATELGADAVVVEELAAAKEMEREVLLHLGPLLAPKAT